MLERDTITEEHFYYRENLLFCENLPIEQIINETETPVYIYSNAILRSKYRAIVDAFSETDSMVCFSVKSCSNLSVLKILIDEGSGFDIVSGGELFRIKKAGGDTSKTVFSGVGKTDEDITYALEQNILLFNVESREELENINRIAGLMGLNAPISLRINPDVDPNTHYKTTTGKKENKFGINVPDAKKIVKEFDKYSNCVLKGLSMHIGSPVYETEPYSEALERMLSFIESSPGLADQLEYVDCGGGFALLYGTKKVPAFSEYASAIIPYIKKTGCKLLLEPGRSIAGNAAVLVGKVQYRKSNAKKNFVILDAGMHNLVRTAMYDAYHGIWAVNGSQCRIPHGVAIDAIPTIPTDVVGPICETSDTFCEDRPLPQLERGDLVAIFSAGAYGFSMSSNYNSHPFATEVLVDNDSWRVMRKRQSWEELIVGELT